MKFTVFGALITFAAVLLGAPNAAVAQTPRSERSDATPDYSPADAWLCRPDRGPCGGDLTATRLGKDGSETVERFAPAPNPQLDCFYVYPTVSADDATFSDMVPGQEELAVVRNQAARLASRCRLFAPMYRQFTLSALRQAAAGKGRFDFEKPYADVLAAWRWYMKNENRGRGVVLVGHSQGTIILQRLIAEQIDGRPGQNQMVLALLAGDPALSVPPGSATGGTFKHVPLCSKDVRSRCVFVWASYAEPLVPGRAFGYRGAGGLEPACVSPASPEGKSSKADSYIPLAVVASGQPAFLATAGGYEVSCVSDAAGSALRVKVAAGPNSAKLEALMKHYLGAPAWGLHRMDLYVVQGDVLRRIDEAARDWPQFRPTLRDHLRARR